MSNTNVQTVQIERLNEIVEEEVVVSVGGYELVCFIGALPYKLENGTDYPAKLRLLILEDYRVGEIPDDSIPAISRRGGGYAYQITGQLVEGRLHACGFEFENDALETEYAYLEGKMISVDVDRVDIRFLRK